MWHFPSGTLILTQEKRRTLARLFLEALLWNDWENDPDQKEDEKGETQPLFVINNYEGISVGESETIGNFILLDRQTRIQAWLLAFLSMCCPEFDAPKTLTIEASIFAVLKILMNSIHEEIDLEMYPFEPEETKSLDILYRYRKLAVESVKAFTTVIDPDTDEEVELNIDVEIKGTNRFEWYDRIDNVANFFLFDRDFEIFKDEHFDFIQADEPFKDAIAMFAIALSQVLLHDTLDPVEEIEKRAIKVKYNPDDTFMQVLAKVVSPSELKQMNDIAITHDLFQYC